MTKPTKIDPYLPTVEDAGSGQNDDDLYDKSGQSRPPARETPKAPVVKAPKGMEKLVAALQKQLEARRTEMNTSPTVRGKKTDLAPEREGHAGRRGDILEEYHKTGKYDGRELDSAPLIIKVSIAGSGCHVMASQEGKKDKTLLKIAGGKGAPATYADDKGDVTFTGPMGVGGASDTGDNSINELVAKVPKVIKAAIPDQGHEGGNNVIVLIKAHSRGAVAAGIVSKQVKADFPKISVETVLFDPVPGPVQSGDRLENTIGELDESTLIYAIASGKWVTGFTPQKIHSAKRIIITRAEHHGRAKKGFRLGKVEYKGSRINSLPRGAYYETEVVDEIGVLKAMTKDEVGKVIKDTMKDKESYWNTDSEREAILTAALNEFFGG